MLSIQKMDNAFQRKIQTIVINNFLHKNIDAFFEDAKQGIIRSMKSEIERLHSVKVYSC